MWLSIPQSSSVRRSERLATVEQYSPLLKQPNSSFSRVFTSGSNAWISATVGPSPLEYCVLTRIGSPRMSASRISSCELRTTRSFSKMKGSSFSWISITASAHSSGFSSRRAASICVAGSIDIVAIEKLYSAKSSQMLILCWRRHGGLSLALPGRRLPVVLGFRGLDPGRQFQAQVICQREGKRLIEPAQAREFGNGGVSGGQDKA